jgi:hypothetical protein
MNFHLYPSAHFLNEFLSYSNISTINLNISSNPLANPAEIMLNRANLLALSFDFAESYTIEKVFNSCMYVR